MKDSQGLFVTWMCEHDPQADYFEPEFDENGDVWGFIVVHSGAGPEPRLECPIDMLSFPTSEKYKVRIRKVRAAWERWTTFLIQRGVNGIPVPRFYLIQKETA